jgi:ADP-ribose pyrophosphatase YjhB (NUDIX family)
VAEETGLAVRVTSWLGRVERDAPGGGTFVIDDYACEVVGGRLRAGDDATDARWVAADELAGLPLVPGLLEALTGWGVLAGGRGG